MKLKCVAIDDVPFALDLIKLYAEQMPELEMVQTFDDAIVGLQYLKNNPVDLLFLDINMPDISGLTLARSLKKKPLLIFTTAHKDYAFDGFELEAIDFLLKPIEFERFSKAVQKALNAYLIKRSAEENNGECIVVYSEYKAIKIPLSEIEYIESLEDYIKIHLPQGRPILTLLSLKKVLERLPADKFKRIHRSYAVPVNKVKSISNRKVTLASGKILPIGISYLDFIKDWKDS